MTEFDPVSTVAPAIGYAEVFSLIPGRIMDSSFMRYSTPNAKKFAGSLKLLAKTTDKAEGAKIALSKVLQAIPVRIERLIAR
jgi:hypothetical protein